MAEQDLGGMVFEMEVDPSKLEKGLDQAERAVDSTFAAIDKKMGGFANSAFGPLQKKLDGFGRQATAAGRVLTAGLTLPILALGAGSLKAAISFESAFAGVRKTVNATEAEFAELERGIRDMSKATPASAVSISKVAESAGQLGIARENILSFSKVMIDMGVSTNLSADDAASALARLANITQMPQDQFDRLGATIVALGNNGASTESEIVDMALRIAGAGHTVGLTEAQILSFANALSSVGIEAQMGGSAISRVMIDMANSVASGGAKLTSFARVAGMSATEFSTAFKTDAAGAITTFIEGLGGISKAGGNVFAVLDDLGLSEIRVRDALLRASGAGDLFRESLELGDKAWQDNTALAKEAEARYRTTASRLKILANNVMDAAITLGRALMPTLNDVMDTLKPVVGWLQRGASAFSQLSPQVKTGILLFVGLVAAVGPVLLGLGAFAGAISALLPVFVALTGPVGLLVLAVVALTAALYLLRKPVAEVARVFLAGFGGKEAGEELSSFQRDVYAVGKALGDVVGFVKDNWGTISRVVTAAFEIMVTVATTRLALIWDTLKLGVQVAVGIFKFWKGVLTGQWSDALDALKGIANNFLDWLKSIPGRAWGMLRDVGKSLGEALGEGLRDQLVDVLNWAIRQINAVSGQVKVLGKNVNPLSGLHIDEIVVPAPRASSAGPSGAGSTGATGATGAANAVDRLATSAGAAATGLKDFASETHDALGKVSSAASAVHGRPTREQAQLELSIARLDKSMIGASDSWKATTEKQKARLQDQLSRLQAEGRIQQLQLTLADQTLLSEREKLKYNTYLINQTSILSGWIRKAADVTGTGLVPAFDDSLNTIKNLAGGITDGAIPALDGVTDAALRVTQAFGGLERALPAPVDPMTGKPRTPLNPDDPFWGFPAYSHGIESVPHTGPAIVHEGERIIPADQNRGGMEAAASTTNSRQFYNYGTINVDRRKPAPTESDLMLRRL